MPKILRIGLAVIRYKGEVKTVFRGAVEGRKYVEVFPNDMVIVSIVDSITYTKGTQWERVESDVDISTLFSLAQPLNLSDIDDEAEEKVKGGDDISNTNDAKASEVTELREATLENINDLHLDEVKYACKKFGIKHGKKKIEDLIPLLLPFLQQESQA